MGGSVTGSVRRRCFDWGVYLLLLPTVGLITGGCPGLIHWTSFTGAPVFWSPPLLLSVFLQLAVALAWFVSLIACCVLLLYC
jgi:hypothetical protein